MMGRILLYPLIFVLVSQKSWTVRYCIPNFLGQARIQIGIQKSLYYTLAYVGMLGIKKALKVLIFKGFYLIGFTVLR